MQCKVCGTETFKKVGGKSVGSEEDHQYTPPDDGVKTISNVREATGSPSQPESDESAFGPYVLILLLMIVVVLALYFL
jgi:hypothetical protein